MPKGTEEEEMTIIKNIGVTAGFDSGTFLGFSAVSTEGVEPGQQVQSIQSAYNLSFKDFNALEIMIAATISSYIEEKKK